MAINPDKMRGCLLGGAVGDALGAPVEFLSDAAILHRYGPGGIADFESCYGVVGAVTDDTQMTLWTLEGLCRGIVRGQLRGVSSIYSVVHGSLLRWLKTQGLHPAVDMRWMPDGWMLGERTLWARRGPGTTCLSALSHSSSLGEMAWNDRKGCGGVMRVAPVGFMHDSFFELGADCAHLTHGHPTGYLTAGYLAEVIAGLQQTPSLERALTRADAALARASASSEAPAALVGETAQALANARHEAELALKTGVPSRIPTSLGEGWVAEETLAIAVYCALVGRDFEHAVRLAVNHGGDSDSTGSVTGQILGARDGVAVIPQRWLAKVECVSIVDRLVETFVGLDDGSVAAEDIIGDFPEC